MKHLKIRIPMYFIGLFVMTIGIALSVKSWNPHHHGARQHCICGIWYLFVFAGRSDSTCRRGLYAGVFLCNTY